MNTEEKREGINTLINTIPKDILGNKDLKIVVFDTKTGAMPFIRLIINDQDVAEIIMTEREKRIIVYDMCDIAHPCRLADISSAPADMRYMSGIHYDRFYCQYAPYNRPTSEFNSTVVCPYTALCDKIKEFAKAHPKDE